MTTHSRAARQRLTEPADELDSVLGAIAWIARRRNNKDGLRLLAKSLSSRHGEVRQRSAEVMGILLAGGIAPRSLIHALQSDPDELVRTEAAESLGAIGDPRARRVLRGAMTDRSPLVRAYAASAIANIRGRSDAALLRKRLAVERNPQVRASLVEALYSAGDRSALPRLLKFLSNKNYRVRCAAANAIGAAKPTKEDRASAIGALRDAANKERTAAAASSIGATLRLLRSGVAK